MTAKEKFFQAIEQLGAKRVTEFGWANIPDQNVWVAYHCKDVHIFAQPDGGQHFDHFIIGVEQCHWDNMVLCAIIRLTNLDDDYYCAAEDERILLRQFAYDDTDMTEEDLMHAIWYLFEHDECIINSISPSGWSQYIKYEDDKPDQSVLLALASFQQPVVTLIESLFAQAKDLGVGYYQDEDNNIVFYNANNVRYDSEGTDCTIFDESHAYHSGIQPDWWNDNGGFKVVSD